MMNVMLVSVAVWSAPTWARRRAHALHWVAAAIALPVVLGGGHALLPQRPRGIRAGRLNMDLAVLARRAGHHADAVSEAARNGDFTWFDGATALLALLLAGRVLDRAARRRARQAWPSCWRCRRGTAHPRARRHRPHRAVDARRARRPHPGRGGERLRLDAVLDDGAEPALLDTAATTGESLARATSSPARPCPPAR
jgi:Cu2+-exporting ATPase